MNLARLPLAALLASLVAGGIAACYSSADTTPSPAPATTTPTTGTPTVADSGATVGAPQSAFALGQALAQSYGCTGCHGADLSGNIEQDGGVYSANLTPDMDTGIGSWTLANLTSALRDGLDDQGQMICAVMPRFPALTDDDIVALYAYLQGIPAVSKAQTDTDCDGNPQSGDDDDDDGGAEAGSGDDDASAEDAGDGGTGPGDAAAADAAPDASDPCPHKVCEQGAPLEPSCGGCATAVCSHDPGCCDTAWGSTCVSEVNQYCVTQCN